MLINASWLHRYLDDSSQVKVAFALPFVANWKVLNAHDVLVLAAACAIIGTGSPSKLKYCALTVTPEAAEAILDEHRARKVMSLIAQGRLVKSDASLTCVRSIVPAKREGNIGAFIVHRHVRTGAFVPADREELRSTGVSFRPRNDPTCGGSREVKRPAAPKLIPPLAQPSA